MIGQIWDNGLDHIAFPQIIARLVVYMEECIMLNMQTKFELEVARSKYVPPNAFMVCNFTFL